MIIATCDKLSSMTIIERERAGVAPRLDEAQGLIVELSQRLETGLAFLLVDGPVASGKTELVKGLKSEFNGLMGGVEPTVIEVDWAVQSREYRSQHPEKLNRHQAWFRLHRHYGLLHQYLRGQENGELSITHKNFYQAQSRTNNYYGGGTFGRQSKANKGESQGKKSGPR